MTTSATENIAPQDAPPQIIGKIETDVFCSACHYNLHSLDVIRDPRLDIAIVRCPECGKFHPAGAATGAGRVWLTRLAMFLIMAWILFIVGFVLLMGFGFFVTDGVAIEGFLRGTQINNRYVRVPYIPEYPEGQRELFFMNALVFGIAKLLGLTLGTGMSVFVWHKKRIWLVSLCLLSLMAVAFAGAIFSTETQYWGPGTKDWAIGRLVTLVLLQCGGILLGILLGRAVVRGILSLLLPRRLLQHVRFLWTVDNKVPPGVD